MSDLNKHLVLVRHGTCSLVAKGTQYVMLYNDETDMVTSIPDDPTVVTPPARCPPNLVSTGSGRSKTAEYLPSTGLTGSVHKATVLGSDQIWINSSDDKEKVTRSSNGFTYVVPKAGTSNGSERLYGDASVDVHGATHF
ncbi:hypothetical protein E4U31_004492 [Claviceps sp. LM219 group G6]|nr:hypothetical protein E4U15_008279 [Claviceps sp. LM218 group G6]KAG6099210.1 hypothetical protein E4U31_004492 [Claviceps sp. LM219 group G6]